MSTNEHPENKPAETEKGFGTGLRAQLERRRAEDETPEAAGPTNVELRFELTARPAGDAESLVVGPELTELRSELEAAQLASHLPEQPTSHRALNDFLVRLRLASRDMPARDVTSQC